MTDEENIMNAYRRGFEAAHGHTAPSAETVAMITSLNTSLASIEEKLEKLSALDINTLNKLTSGYKGVVFVSGVITGLAGVMLAVAAIAKLSIYMIRSIK